MVLNFDIKKLLKNVAIPVIVGALAGFLTKNDVTEFMETANKPFFMPPGWLFPVAWTILYVLMGVAAYYIDISKAIDKDKALLVYYAQLFFNFVWSFIFFTAGKYLFAFVWIVVLWLLILLTIIKFKKIDTRTVLLLAPYLVWVTFAAILNLSIYILNR